jgi:acyl dehydratase
MTSLHIGQIILDERVLGASKENIALFSKATEDPNPIHTDLSFANECGFREVLQQGPMTTAHFVRLLSKKLGAKYLRVFDINFTAPVYPLEDLHFIAVVEEISMFIKLSLNSKKMDGTISAKGFAIIAKEAFI